MRRIVVLLLVVGLAFLWIPGCSTYGVLNKEQTASLLGVEKQELKTPDTVRGR